MSPRWRALSFGSAAAAIALGALAVGLASGTTVRIVGITLVTVGLGGALLLVFLEVGLSEDRARAERHPRRAPRHVEERPPWRSRRPRRPR